MFGLHNVDATQWVFGCLFSVFFSVFIILVTKEDSIVFKKPISRTRYRITYITSLIATIIVMGVLATW